MGRMWGKINDINITIPTLILAGIEDEIEADPNMHG